MVLLRTSYYQNNDIKQKFAFILHICGCKNIIELILLLQNFFYVDVLVTLVIDFCKYNLD